MRKRVKTRVPSNKTREKYQLSSIWQQQWRDYARNLSQRPPLQRACGSYKNRRLSAPCFTLDPQPMEFQTLQQNIKGSRSKKPIWLAQMFHKDDDRKIISKRLNSGSVSASSSEASSPASSSSSYPYSSSSPNTQNTKDCNGTRNSARRKSNSKEFFPCKEGLYGLGFRMF
jgi:hypothetical protein